MYYFGPGLGLAEFFALSFAATLALAILSWHLVEAPALRLRRWGSQWRSAAAKRPAPA